MKNARVLHTAQILRFEAKSALNFTRLIKNKLSQIDLVSVVSIKYLEFVVFMNK